MSRTPGKSEAPDGAGRRRYAPGQRRIAHILAAAAQVFAEAGYERATTNAIAAKAGISPGSLYQYFANKEEIARAVADGYAADVRAMWATVFTPEAARRPLDSVLGAIVDAVIAFKLNRAGFAVLFEGAQTIPALAAAATGLHDEFIARFAELLALRRPDLPAAETNLAALVAVRGFKAVLPLVIEAPAGRRAAVSGEIKRLLLAYLTPVFGRPPGD